MRDLKPEKWHKIKKRSEVYCKPGLYAIYYNKNNKEQLAYIGRSSNLYKRTVNLGSSNNPNNTRLVCSAYPPK